ncbi:biotin transporter BioY [Desulfonatronum lacustre]|uniref:biotin transporter BioY n=1 Tax=Desulfonatronum lacustre TaxID=66849 RepID=UPI00048FCA62|nr:biotin transporter BioY [Desulfonatronum lacustre]
MPATTSLQSLHVMVWTALMASLIAVGSFLSIPLGPVPFSMQPLFIMLAGFLLGWPHGMIAVLLFVAAGSIGLPVFAGGKSGLAVLFGPTGGYLIGFVLAAGAIGLLTQARKTARTPSQTPSWALGLLAGLLGLALLYACGLLNLVRVLDIGWNKALTIGFLPFILQDLVKLVMAVATWRIMHGRGLLPR